LQGRGHAWQPAMCETDVRSAFGDRVLARLGRSEASRREASIRTGGQ
jgi:hypothetical protein